MNDTGQSRDVGSDVARRNASYGSWHRRIDLVTPKAMATTTAHEQLAEASAQLYSRNGVRNLRKQTLGEDVALEQLRPTAPNSPKLIL